MQISEELVKQITNAVLSQMSQSGVSSSAGDTISVPSAGKMPSLAGRERINEEKTSYASYPRAKKGTDPKEVVIGVGKFGPYVRHDGKFVSLAKTDDPYTIELDRAIELIKEKREKDAKAKVPICTYPEDPSVQVLNGRYGPYIACNGKNYRIPKGQEPEKLTLEQCREIMAKAKK